jgi:hypothetical protein
MAGPKLAYGQGWIDVAGELPEPVVIPTVGIWGAVLGAPFQEGFYYPQDRVRSHVLRLGLGHELMVAAEGLVSVGAEVHLLALDLDVPDAASFLEERIGGMRHFANPPVV